MGIGGFQDLTFEQLSLTQDGANAVIGLDTDTPLAQLQGVEASSLTAEDLTFASEAPV